LEVEEGVFPIFSRGHEVPELEADSIIRMRS